MLLLICYYYYFFAAAATIYDAADMPLRAPRLFFSLSLRASIVHD